MDTGDGMQIDLTPTSPDFIHNPKTGTILDQDIRYLMMRPDVLMGIGAALGDSSAFLRALETSTYNNARASLEAYRTLQLLDGDFLGTITRFAGRLGWGEWLVDQSEGSTDHLRVRGSPFAQGIGASDFPVCAPIKGILRALYLVALGSEVKVSEDKCIAQGHGECRFTIQR